MIVTQTAAELKIKKAALDLKSKNTDLKMKDEGELKVDLENPEFLSLMEKSMDSCDFLSLDENDDDSDAVSSECTTTNTKAVSKKRSRKQANSTGNKKKKRKEDRDEDGRIPYLPWTDKEDKRMITLVDQVKSAELKRQQRDLKKKGMKMDEITSFLAKNPPGIQWVKIAKKMTGRTSKQCRERWRNKLNPNITRELWTIEEDLTLMKSHKELGNKWVQISALLPGRTENSVKTRFKSIMRAKKRMWRFEEDNKVLQLYSELGSRWHEISMELPDRTPNGVKMRCRVLLSRNSRKPPEPGAPEQSIAHLYNVSKSKSEADKKKTEETTVVPSKVAPKAEVAARVPPMLKPTTPQSLSNSAAVATSTQAKISPKNDLLTAPKQMNKKKEVKDFEFTPNLTSFHSNISQTENQLKLDPDVSRNSKPSKKKSTRALIFDEFQQKNESFGMGNTDFADTIANIFKQQPTAAEEPKSMVFKKRATSVAEDIANIFSRDKQEKSKNMSVGNDDGMKTVAEILSTPSPYTKQNEVGLRDRSKSVSFSQNVSFTFSH